MESTQLTNISLQSDDNTVPLYFVVKEKTVKENGCVESLKLTGREWIFC